MLLIALLIHAQFAAAEGPAGPAFSDPEHVESVGKKWRGKLIDRSQWQPVGGEPIDLAVTLDQHLYPALKPLIGQFAKEHDLRVAIQEGTCGISAGKLMDKVVDIGGFCCPAGEVDRLPGLRYHTLGIAPLALLVHPSNTLENVTLAQARGIFQGNIHHWSELGVGEASKNEMAIEPVVRLHCKSRPGHWRLLLDNEDLFGTSVYEVSTIPDMIHRVATQSRGIGYETLWMTERYREEGQVKVLSLDGVSPRDDAAVAQGRYPLYRSYNITTWSGEKTRNPDAEALAEYLMSHFDTVDRRYGILPASTLKAQGWKFRDTELTGEPD